MREGSAPIARICCSVYWMREPAVVAALEVGRIRCMMLLPGEAAFCSGCISCLLRKAKRHLGTLVETINNRRSCCECG